MPSITTASMVGYVTSGTSVPYARFAGGGISEAPSDAHELRPIGLALITSSLTYRTGPTHRPRRR